MTFAAARVILTSVRSSTAELTGSVMMLAPVVGGLQSVGIDANDVLGRHGMSLADLANPSARVASQKLLDIWDDAVVVSEDENFGLRAAMFYRRGMFQVLDYVISSASHLRAAFEQVRRYMKILHDLAGLELVEDEQVATMTLSELSPTQPPRALEDFGLACALLVCRRITNEKLIPVEIRLQHGKPGDASLLADVFGCHVVYDQGRTQMLFPRRFFDLECATADAALSQVVNEHAARLLEELKPREPLVYRIEKYIVENLSDGPSLEMVARELHMSSRTLRRRLAERDTRFQELLDGTRETMAKRLIKDERLSLDQVASELGFADSSSFHRAFKRWTDASPAVYRRRSA